MRPDVVMRRAAADEADAVVALWQACDAIPSVTDDPGSVRALLARDPEALLLAEAGGELIGSVIAGWDGWRGNIYRLAVRPSHRRQGIAMALVREAEHRLAARGARRVSALVVEAEEHAVRFWRAAGYDLDARIARFVRTL